MALVSVFHQSDGRSMAHDRYGLWKLGITHVLNAAHGKMCCQGSHDFYGTTVDYYGVPANDLPTFDLSPYFYPSAHYIHETLNIPNGESITAQAKNSTTSIWENANSFCLRTLQCLSCAFSSNFFPGGSSPNGFYIDIRIFSIALCNLMQSTSSLSPAKIFVHCAVGVSRSASLVLAYLMIYHHLPLMDAIKRVKENRWIFPNRGFLKQLRQLDATLQREKSVEWRWAKSEWRETRRTSHLFNFKAKLHVGFRRAFFPGWICILSKINERLYHLLCMHFGPNIIISIKFFFFLRKRPFYF